ncbi:MAG: hypothetical protein LBT05_14280 [Planctomycetaceae bacterium]|jgi:hypothetical protein|nr:hypothetical protein [Planctomycetaceae bacterium]
MSLEKIASKYYFLAFTIVLFVSSFVSAQIPRPSSVSPAGTNTNPPPATLATTGERLSTDMPPFPAPTPLNSAQPDFAQPDVPSPNGETRENLQENNPAATRFPGNNSSTGNPAAIDPPNSGGTLSTVASSLQEEKNNKIQYFISVNDQSHPIYQLVALERPRDSLVTGKKTYLYEILSGISASGRQELTEAYWKLSEKLLLCHARIGQKRRISKVKAYYQNHHEAYKELELAEQLTDRQYKALELEFIQAQYQFVHLRKKYAVYRYDTPTFAAPSATSYRSERPTTDAMDSQSLPIPAEFPLAVPYNTKIKELEKYRSLSQKTLLLDRTIPLQYQSVIVRADARKCAEDKMRDDLNAQRSIVASIETLTNEEIELVKAVVEYNRQVDNYVIETYGANISLRQFLASILQLPKRPTQTIRTE